VSFKVWEKKTYFKTYPADKIVVTKDKLIIGKNFRDRFNKAVLILYDPIKKLAALKPVINDKNAYIIFSNQVYCANFIREMKIRQGECQAWWDGEKLIFKVSTI